MKGKSGKEMRKLKIRVEGWNRGKGKLKGLTEKEDEREE